MVAKGEIVLTGIPASPGISIGPCYLYVEKPLIPDPVLVRKNSLEAEITRFRRAVKKTHSYLKKSYQDTARYQNKNLNEILELQLAILEDDIFLKEVEDLIRAELYNAAYA
ncbi:MAG: phosphoenolpyruvate-utilizing N-terminal domain-containing protein, partial [Calditrichia bacterium]